MLLAVVAVVLLALCGTADGYNLTSGQYTVSGLSAGAFMAVQYHVAFSSEVRGAAVFAGGPYYCAQGSITSALTTCTSFPLALDVSALESAAQNFASQGKIDPLTGLQGDSVFLYSGTSDTVVKQDVVKAAGTFYSYFGAKVGTEFSKPSEHCQPTLNFGNDCSELASPYISRCGYDGVGNAFNMLMPNLMGRTKGLSQNILKIDQSKYFPSGEVPGLADTAYLYVPTACGTGAKCSLHIAFHGCSQDMSTIGQVFVQNAGYLQWAEPNNIIVLFPQAAASLFHENPEACFDWWGYVDANYAFKNSQQMATFRNMVKAIGTPSGPVLKK